MREKYGEYRTSYEIKIQNINGNKKYKGTKLIIYVKNGKTLEYGKNVSFIRKL